MSDPALPEPPPSRRKPRGAAVPAPPPTIWEQVKRHKVAQWTLAYIAAAYTILHGAEMIAEALDWPHLVIRALTLILIIGTPVVATLAWYHGTKGTKRVSIGEVLIIALLAGVGAILMWHFRVGSTVGPIHADTATLTTQTPSNTPIANNAIAVLPFLDLSERHDQEYFSDGMTEEILNLLVKVPGLKVIGRTSSFQYKGKTDDLRNIGTALGAAYVVEGSVRRSDAQVRVTAQLIDARDGTHRWSDTFDRTLTDTLSIQEDVATSVVRALQIEISDSALAQDRVIPKNTDTYDAFLRGLHAFNRFDEQGFNDAAADFRRALDEDPAYLPAAEQLANTLFSLADFGFVAPKQGFDATRSAAMAAIALDPTSAKAHSILALVHIEFDWDWAAAEKELNVALKKAPNDPDVLTTIAQQRLAIGRWDEAERFIDAAITRDPFAASWRTVRSWIRMRLGQLDGAEADARQVLKTSPTYSGGHWQLAKVLAAQGKLLPALEELQLEQDPTTKDVGLVLLNQALQRPMKSAAAFGELRHHPEWPLGMAMACTALGHKDDAFRWLDRAFETKDSGLYLVKGEYFLRALESDPRYKAFLRKMNLPE